MISQRGIQHCFVNQGQAQTQEVEFNHDGRKSSDLVTTQYSHA